MGIEGANQTIFVRRIALRPPISYFGKMSFGTSQTHSPFKRFLATVAGLKIKQDWWVIEEPEDTQSVPAAASRASGSANIEEGSDSEDSSDEE